MPLGEESREIAKAVRGLRCGRNMYGIARAAPFY